MGKAVVASSVFWLFVLLLSHACGTCQFARQLGAPDASAVTAPWPSCGDARIYSASERRCVEP